MKKTIKCAVMVGTLCSSLLFFTRSNIVSAKSFTSPVTKIAGSNNYDIYHRVSKSGPSGKFTSTKYFKYGYIQSKRYESTKDGNYWDIYVNGRHVGWVSERFFARNEISVANSISLVRNPSYKFKTTDAINYATDSQGTLVNNNKVKVSQAYITDQPGIVKYSYGKAKATTNVSVYDASTTASIVPKKGPRGLKTWTGKNRAATVNSRTYRSNGLTLTTKFMQPLTMSLNNAIGGTPEGTSYRGGIFATTRQNSNSLYGHIISFNLNNIKSKTAAYNLNNLSWSTFRSYSSNIKVSPYMRVGHGQSIGQSANYIYVMANNNRYSRSMGPASEEIFQIRKSDMKITKIWTYKITNVNDTTRYIHNASFDGDNTMYALYHNGNGSYEYYRLNLEGNRWVPQEVAATEGNLVSGGPVQGFTYGDGKFYIAFNDVILKMNSDGSHNNTYKFNLRREIEGLSFDNSRLYVQFIVPRELAFGVPK